LPHHACSSPTAGLQITRDTNNKANVSSFSQWGITDMDSV